MEKVLSHQHNGRNVIYGDAVDADFWYRVEPARSKINLVMLALPDLQSASFVIKQLRERGFQGRTVTSVRYEDDRSEIERVGIDAAFSLREEAGAGFADHICAQIGFCGR